MQETENQLLQSEISRPKHEYQNAKKYNVVSKHYIKNALSTSQ